MLGPSCCGFQIHHLKNVIVVTRSLVNIEANYLTQELILYQTIDYGVKASNYMYIHVFLFFYVPWYKISKRQNVNMTEHNSLKRKPICSLTPAIYAIQVCSIHTETCHYDNQNVLMTMTTFVNCHSSWISIFHLVMYVKH